MTRIILVTNLYHLIKVSAMDSVKVANGYRRKRQQTLILLTDSCDWSVFHIVFNRNFYTPNRHYTSYKEQSRPKFLSNFAIRFSNMSYTSNRCELVKPWYYIWRLHLSWTRAFPFPIETLWKTLFDCLNQNFDSFKIWKNSIMCNVNNDLAWLWKIRSL